MAVPIYSEYDNYFTIISDLLYFKLYNKTALENIDLIVPKQMEHAQLIYRFAMNIIYHISSIPSKLTIPKN